MAGRHGWGLWRAALPLTDMGHMQRQPWWLVEENPKLLCPIAFGMPGGHRVKVACGQLKTVRERPEVEPRIVQTHVPFRALGFCLQGQP